MYNAQHSDPVIKEVAEALQHSLAKSQGRLTPTYCYLRMWNQLIVADGIVCRKYSLDPSSDIITVPVFPYSLQQDALYRSHDAPAAGHQSIEKTSPASVPD